MRIAPYAASLSEESKEGYSSARQWFQERSPRQRLIIGNVLLAGLMFLAFLYIGSLEQQNQVAHMLAVEMKKYFRNGGMLGIPIAAVYAALIISFRLLCALSLIALFFVFEQLFRIRRLSFQELVRSLGIRVFSILILMAFSPILNRLLPSRFPLPDLIRVDAEHLGFLPDAVVLTFGVILSILLSSFAQYWSHRLQHSSAILWKFHSVHHSVRDMDVLNSASHPVDTIGTQLFAVLIATIVTLDFQSVALVLLFFHINEQRIHTNLPINLGPLSPYLIDNRHHFIHHSADPSEYGRNFGSLITLWDRLFGTAMLPDSDALRTTGIAGVCPPRNGRQFLMAQLENEQMTAHSADPHTPSQSSGD